MGKKVYEGRTGRGVRGRPPVNWIHRVSGYWSKRFEVDGLSVLRGIARRGRDGDTCGTATHRSSQEGAAHQGYTVNPQYNWGGGSDIIVKNSLYLKFSKK